MVNFVVMFDLRLAWRQLAWKKWIFWRKCEISWSGLLYNIKHVFNHNRLKTRKVLLICLRLCFSLTRCDSMIKDVKNIEMQKSDKVGSLVVSILHRKVPDKKRIIKELSLIISEEEIIDEKKTFFRWHFGVV